MKGRTAFIIAHRFSALKHCDVLLMIEDGRLITQRWKYQGLSITQCDSADYKPLSLGVKAVPRPGRSKSN